jgi:palmitoyl-protein thioesterase
MCIPLIFKILLLFSESFSNHIKMKNFTLTQTMAQTITTTITTTSYDKIPIVLMHGLLSNQESMFELKYYLELQFGVKVFVPEIGNGILNSINMPLYKQGDLLCSELNLNSDLKDGFNFIGISQGGILGRYYVEKCNGYPVHNLITLVSPHGGVYNKVYANSINFYGFFAQEHYSFSSYWRDPTQINLYYNQSLLANLNNEVYSKYSELNKNRMLMLKNFIMVFSTNDSIVLPPESGKFSMYNNSSLNVIPYTDTISYKTLGLDILQNSGRLHIYQTNCSHDDHATYHCFKHLYEMFKTYCG